MSSSHFLYYNLHEPHSQTIPPPIIPASSPTGKKIESKPQLARTLGDTIDLSTFDYQAGRVVPSATHMMLQQNALKRKQGVPLPTASSSSNSSPAPAGPNLPPPVPIYNQLPPAGRPHHHHHHHQQFDYRYRSGDRMLTFCFRLI